MNSKIKFFKKNKLLPLDEFFENVLFNNKDGYYSSKIPFGHKGDFLTAPNISNLFSEIIGVWLISSWNTLGKPKKFNIVELGPGNGSLTKILIKTFDKFPSFKRSTNIFLFEKSPLLEKIQKKNISCPRVKWIKNFNQIKKGPIIFFGNEFFDSIPIKQFLKKDKSFLEKNIFLNQKDQIIEVFKKASKNNIMNIKKFKVLKKLKFIEFPKLGFVELKKIIKKITSLGGGILLIDYGYLNPNNKNTLQSVRKHKKNNLYENLGDADITYLVNFNLLKEFFSKNNLKVKNIVSQKFFLERMGIVERADNLCKRMSFKDQSNMYLRLKRILDNKFMGNLFKVIFAYKFKNNNFLGFQ